MKQENLHNNGESGCEFSGQFEYDLDEARNGKPVYELSEETYKRVSSLKNQLITFWLDHGRYVSAYLFIFLITLGFAKYAGMMAAFVVFFLLLYAAEKWFSRS